MNSSSCINCTWKIALCSFYAQQFQKWDKIKHLRWSNTLKFCPFKIPDMLQHKGLFLFFSPLVEDSKPWRTSYNPFSGFLRPAITRGQGLSGRRAVLGLLKWWSLLKPPKFPGDCMCHPPSALALGWHPPAVHKIFTSFCSHLHQKAAERESHPAPKAVIGDDSPKAWGNGWSKGEREDMTVSPPAKGSTGVKPNCRWVKTWRRAQVELTDSRAGVPREWFLPSHTLTLSVSRAPCR